MSKTAVITGITGQDGAYLAQYLLEKGYRVVGAFRRASTVATARLDSLGITDEVELVPFDLTDPRSRSEGGAGSRGVARWQRLRLRPLRQTALGG